jgi:hypothetical protein
MSSPRKAQVAALLKSIETGDAAPAAVVNPAKYIQHNLSAGDGLAGLGALLAARVCAHRIRLLRPEDRLRRVPL